MSMFAVTFGQKYRFEKHPACSKIDPDSFLRVEAENELEARHKVIAAIGNEWAFIYEWDEFEPQIVEYGLWDVTLYVANSGMTQSERAVFQSLVSRGLNPLDAREAALDGVEKP